MITINLLPGAQRTTGNAGGLAVFANAKEHVRDPWLMGATAAVILSITAVSLLFTNQQARAAQLSARIDLAVKDSVRYSSVLSARHKLMAERDSVQRQLHIIRSIDDARYQWAHIMDEVSRALPAFTWLTVMEQTSTPPLPPGVDTVKADTARRGKRAEKDAKANAPKAPVEQAGLRFRLVGQTVDIQALTLYMRQLESSPFIEHVALTRSEIVVVDGKDVTEFELTAAYESPAPGVTKTQALVVPVR